MFCFPKKNWKYHSKKYNKQLYLGDGVPNY